MGGHTCLGGTSRRHVRVVKALFASAGPVLWPRGGTVAASGGHHRFALRASKSPSALVVLWGCGLHAGGVRCETLGPTYNPAAEDSAGGGDAGVSPLSRVSVGCTKADAPRSWVPAPYFLTPPAQM